MNWTARLSAKCWEPALAEQLLSRLNELVPDLESVCNQAPDGGVALINFLCFSPISFEKVCLSTPLLHWLAGPDVLTSKRGRWRGSSDPVSDPDFQALRAWKSQELLRVAFREVSGLAGFVETTRDITEIAEQCVRQVYQNNLTTLTSRWGTPSTGFGVVGMGKFGGRELNYSSDIDVIFLYHTEGHINPRFSYHEFFTRLSERIIAAFAEKRLFRIDVRLRPEGTSGPLVRSLTSTEN